MGQRIAAVRARDNGRYFGQSALVQKAQSEWHLGGLTLKQTLLFGVAFVAFQVLLTLVWNAVDNDPEPWASILRRSTAVAVMAVFLMRWRFRRLSRQHEE